ncbi:hypothetical protein RI543_000513 [Arxiozyma heterogenica]|uniref:TECPR1-like DysF domain-containing protein n=1 Tax=Arxiozyma heterogenica TaxID=278026 RepID=A0AAN8A850_9SACH|nr:hypothetical protein RI543_000513 [Kazachstania heterogenica]
MTENVNEKTAAAKDKGIIRKFLENKYDQLLNSILDVTEDQIVLKSKLAHSDVAENQIDRKQKRKLNHIDNLLLDREIEGLNYFTEQQTVVSNPTINNKELIYHAISTFINASIDKIRLDRMTKSSSLPATQEKNDTSIDTILENDTFLDIFMERLLSRIIRDKLPEREHITEKETSHKEKHAQLVSPSILASNLGKMSKQLNSIFEFQDSFIRLLTWKTPSYTILTLLIISLILFHPLYLILLPILYIAYGLITPSYTQKHNLRNFDYHLKKQYGKSLLEVISSGGKPVACTSNPFKDQINDPIEDLNLVDWEDSNSGLKFITTIRDFQNMTTNLLALTNSISKFIYETASFKDERKTTILFLKCIQRSTTKKNNLETVGQKNEIGNIIIDTTPQIKEIEIFEIYRKGLIPGEWKFFLYSNNVFDYNDQYRKAQKSPPGVKTLDELYPPKTWKFDNNSTWNIDKNVQEWAYYRGLLDLEIDKEFLCDNMFKRRRLTRKVLK